MEWIEPISLSQEPMNVCYKLQRVLLLADVDQLHDAIPIKPEIVLPTQGGPTTTSRWYGRIGPRLFGIEFEKSSASIQSQTVLLTTPYLDVQDKLGDWTVLLDLAELPSQVYVTRPLRIDSRVRHASFAVYRPDPQGWREPIYYSSDRSDAANLLNYLLSDSWNADCLVDAPDPIGEWGILDRDSEVCIGAYPEKYVALQVACRLSLQKTNADLIVCDLSPSRFPGRYHVSHGRIHPLENR